MPAFHIDPSRIQGAHLQFTADEAHHLRVRRIRPDDIVDAIDGVGTAFRVRLVSLDGDEALGEILEMTSMASESLHELHLVVALIKGQRFDTVVEKATEVGVHTIHPVATQRAVVRGLGKPERWQRVALAAAKQCGRSRVPDILAVADLDQKVADLARQKLLLLVADPDVSGSLQSAWETHPAGTALFIGPEGGFDSRELACMQASGAHSFAWGKRTLRADTAAIVLSALVLDQASRTPVPSTTPQGVSE